MYFQAKLDLIFLRIKKEKLIIQKKTLSEYLEIINNNINIKNNVEPDKKILYNLNSSKATLFPNKYKYISKFNSQNVFSQSPIEKNSEILVSIPHLTPNYFVLCI